MKLFRSVIQPRISDVFNFASDVSNSGDDVGVSFGGGDVAVVVVLGDCLGTGEGGGSAFGG